MSTHPSFVYDKFRPGAETATDGQIWRANREKLEELMRTSAHQIGATLGYGSDHMPGPREEELAAGDATIMTLTREDPPMTPEEAREFGNTLAAGWAAITLVNKPPAYCDTIFALPEEQ